MTLEIIKNLNFNFQNLGRCVEKVSISSGWSWNGPFAANGIPLFVVIIFSDFIDLFELY
jgi:hypothetical protein